MAIKAKVFVRQNAAAKEKVASALIVGLNNVSYKQFCKYIAQDSTVGVADVAAVMAQLEEKLPLLLAMGSKVTISEGGMTVRPTVSGSISQSQLKAKLQTRYDAGDTTVDVNRVLTAGDLSMSDLTASVAINFGNAFRKAFKNEAAFERVVGGEGEEITEDDTEDSGEDSGSGSGSSSEDRPDIM